MLWETSDDRSLSDYPPENNLPEIAPDGAAPGTFPDESASAEPEYLSDCSPKDRPWDEHRSQADQVARIYLNAEESRWLRRQGERVNECSQVLEFVWSPDKADPGVLSLKLRGGYFCRVRLCPVCQVRRSKLWMARFLQAAPGVLAQCPGGRFLFLTFTQKNVEISGLRSELGEISKAWGRLRKRKEFGGVLGWIRTVEVTRGENGSAHPHCHVLAIVPGDYFRRPDKYVAQLVWTQIWRESLGLDYNPVVWVTAVKGKRGRPLPRHFGAETSGADLPGGLIDAARETLKYAVKPDDMIDDPEWFKELTRQVHNLQFISSGGVLKDVLRENDETNDDLLLLGEGEAEQGPRLCFEWWRPVKRYRRQRKGVIQ